MTNIINRIEEASKLFREKEIENIKRKDEYRKGKRFVFSLIKDDLNGILIDYKCGNLGIDEVRYEIDNLIVYCYGRLEDLYYGDEEYSKGEIIAFSISYDMLKELVIEEG